MDNCVYAYSLPDPKLLGCVPTQYDAMRMSFTPDSRKLFIANNGAASVSVIDLQARKSTGHQSQLGKRRSGTPWRCFRKVDVISIGWPMHAAKTT